MKSGLRCAGWTIATAAVLAIIIRAILVCSHTEGGWEILGDHFVASLPPVAADQLCGPQENPERRAAHWILEQLDQLEADPAASSADCMGAALAASQVANTDLPRLSPVTARSIGTAIWARPTSINDPSWNTQRRQLSDELFNRSRQLARRACEIEPGKVNWWRLRTLVIWISSNFGRRGSAADLEVLAECAQHDPENALYDYLAGFEFYCVSSDSRGDSEVDPRFIHDRLLFKRAIDAYRRGLTKEFVSTGNAGACEQQFFARRPGNVAVRLLCTRSAALEATREFIYVEMAAPFWDAINYHAGLGELPTMFRLWQYGQLRLAEQCAAGGEVPTRKNTRAASLSKFCGILFQVFEMEGMTESQRAPAEKRLDEIVILSYEERIDAQKGWQKDYWTQFAIDARKMQEAAFYSALGIAAGAAAFLMLMIAIGVLLLSRLFSRHETSAINGGKLHWPIILWFTLLATTIGILGFVVSYDPVWKDLHVGVQSGIIVLFAAVVGWSVWIAVRAIRRTHSAARSERTLSFHLARLWLVIVGTFLLVVPLFCLVDRKIRFGVFDLWANFPRNLLHRVWQKPTGTIEGIPAALPADAILRWGAHHGLFWTCGVWLVLAVLWFCMRNNNSTYNRTRLAAALRPVCKSAFVIAALLVLLSIAATTQWIASLQVQYDQTLSRLVDAQVAATN